LPDQIERENGPEKKKKRVFWVTVYPTLVDGFSASPRPRISINADVHEKAGELINLARTSPVN
jgi:hypothetical protein